MLENWLKPISGEQLEDFKKYNKNHFGKRILLHHNEFPNISNIQLAFFGVGDHSADIIRKHLYRTNYSFKNVRIADLGNARKTDGTFLIPVIKELLAGGIIPIIIGASIDFTTAQYQAYKSFGEIVNLVLIDERIQYRLSRKEPGFIKPILDEKKGHLFNLSLIGYQKHYTPEDHIKLFKKNNFEMIRLGEMRNHMENTEPLIRDADLVSFNMAAMRQSEAPGQLNATPSGMFVEEACKITHYAGMSDKLSSIGFYGYQPELDIREQTAHLIAQMVWYFIDGYCARKNDYPVSLDGLMEYIVDFKKHDHQLTFWKSTKSGRWWMQVPIKTKKKHQRHKLIPCTYYDYQQACKEDLPPRLLSAYKRFTE